MSTDEQERVTKQLAELHQDAPGEHGVVVIREPSADEVEQIQRADSLIVTTANAAAYQRCLEVHAVVMKGLADLQEADPAGPGEIGVVRTAFGSLAQALRELVSNVEEMINEHASEEVQRAFAQRASEAQGLPSWNDAKELADAEAGSFKLAPNGAVVWQRRSDETILNPAEVAFAAVGGAQALLIRHYVALEPAMLEAARRLRQLAVEAPGGTPGIVEITFRGGKPDLSTMKPRVLALNRIGVALRAVRLATQAIEELEQAAEETSQPEAAEPPDQSEPADTTAEPEPAEPPATQQMPASDARVDGADDDEADDEPEDESETPLPVEFSSLFGLARNLDTDLEKVWSAALDETLLDPAVERQLAAVGTLLSALQRKIAAQEKELQDAGVDARIQEWPLSDETLAELKPEVDLLDTQIHQSRLAQLDALAAVVNTFEGLQQPANLTVTIGQSGESVERFWSAGAFALLKDGLWLLERTTRDHERDLKETLDQQAGSQGTDASGAVQSDEGDGPTADEKPEPVAKDAGDDDQEAERTSDAFERLRLGTQEWVHGDPEAAIFHAVVAVASTLEVPPDQLPAKLTEKAAGNQPALSKEEAEILARAAELVTATLEGQPNLPVATLLAQSALRAAHVLILGPIAGPSLSATELGELIESHQPLQSLEPEDDGGDT